MKFQKDKMNQSSGNQFNKRGRENCGLTSSPSEESRRNFTRLQVWWKLNLASIPTVPQPARTQQVHCSITSVHRNSPGRRAVMDALAASAGRLIGDRNWTSHCRTTRLSSTPGALPVRGNEAQLCVSSLASG